jgi:hypothetical protein
MSRKNRWHDQRQEMAQAIHFLSSLPDDLQTIMGEVVIHITDKDFKVNDVLSTFKSLGHEKILGLNQSKKKRRNYDNNPTLHKAINCIYVLPDEQRIQVGYQLLKLINYVIQYFEAHKKANMPASADTLRSLAQAFAQGGAPEADRILTAIVKDLSLHQVAIGEDHTREGLVARKVQDETDMGIIQEKAASNKKASRS